MLLFFLLSLSLIAQDSSRIQPLNVTLIPRVLDAFDSMCDRYRASNDFNNVIDHELKNVLFCLLGVSHDEYELLFDPATTSEKVMEIRYKIGQQHTLWKNYAPLVRARLNKPAPFFDEVLKNFSYCKDYVPAKWFDRVNEWLVAQAGDKSSGKLMKETQQLIDSFQKVFDRYLSNDSKILTLTAQTMQALLEDLQKPLELYAKSFKSLAGHSMTSMLHDLSLQEPAIIDFQSLNKHLGSVFVPQSTSNESSFNDFLQKSVQKKPKKSLKDPKNLPVLAGNHSSSQSAPQSQAVKEKQNGTVGLQK